MHGVRQVEMPQGRDQVDQVSGGDDYPCLLFLGEVVDVLFEGLKVGGVGCSEPPREDVITSAEGLTDIPSVGHVQNRLQLHWFLVDAMKVDLYFELLISCKETAPIRF